MKYNRKEGNIMWKNFLKRSGWTDIVISLIFILFGAMLIARPESIMSIVAILLGVIFIVIGVLRTVDYFASNKEDNYLIAMALASIVIGIVIMFCSDIILSAFRILIAIWIIYANDYCMERLQIKIMVVNFNFSYCYDYSWNLYISK